MSSSGGGKGQDFTNQWLICNSCLRGFQGLEKLRVHMRESGHFKSNSIPSTVPTPSSSASSSQDSNDSTKTVEFLRKSSREATHVNYANYFNEDSSDDEIQVLSDSRKPKKEPPPAPKSSNGGRRTIPDTIPDPSASPLRKTRPQIDEQEHIDLTASDSDEDDQLLNKDNEIISEFDYTPKFIKGGLMRDYQIRGLNWLIGLFDKRINGILADEMGLGKTLQTIAFLGYLKHFRNSRGPYLVIAPKSCVSNWMAEFKRWCPSIKAICMIGYQEERRDFIKKVVRGGSQFEVLVTTYNLALAEKNFLKHYGWLYIIVDEAHRIKNENCCLSELLRDLTSANRLLLTGTPLQNNLHELWSLLNFLMPQTFTSSEQFDNWFTENGSNNDLSTVEKLHETLRPYLIRRIKADVETSLAPKKELKLYVGITDFQRDIYRKILKKELIVDGGKGGATKTKLMNVLMQLRKCTSHPYLFPGIEPGPPYTTDEHIVHNSGKMIVLDKLLTKLKGEGSRVVLFSQFVMMLNIIEDYCLWKKIEYCRLDGNTSFDDRKVGIDSFNADGSSKFLYLISTRAGGLGINLATADIVIIYDSDWNPQVDLQAMDRCHRIGQKKEVKVYRLVTSNTVEEKMIERAEAKLRLDLLVIQQGRLTDPASASLRKEELSSMVKFGAETIIRTNMPTAQLIGEDIEVILAQSEKKTKELNEKFEGMDEQALTTFTIDENQGGEDSKTLTEILAMPIINCYQFEGKNYKGKGGVDSKVDIMLRPRTRTAVQDYGIYDNDRKLNKAMKDVKVKAGPSSSKTYSKPTPKVNPFAPVIDLAAASGPKIYNPIIPLQIHFQSPRLFDLYYQELDNYRRITGYKPMKNPLIKGKISGEICRVEEDRLSRAQPLSDEEVNEKIVLKREGFSSWTRRDVEIFLRGSEIFGMDNLEDICGFVKGKEVEEIIAYSQVFWEHAHELDEYQEQLSYPPFAKIVSGNWLRLKKLLDAKMNGVKTADQVQIIYKPSSWAGKRFTLVQDQILLFNLHRIGLTVGPELFNILYKVVISESYAHDHFLRARDKSELRHRCLLLLRLVEQEMTGVDIPSPPPTPSKVMNGGSSKSVQKIEGRGDFKDIAKSLVKKPIGKRKKSVGSSDGNNSQNSGIKMDLESDSDTDIEEIDIQVEPPPKSTTPKGPGGRGMDQSKVKRTKIIL